MADVTLRSADVKKKKKKSKAIRHGHINPMK